MRPLFLFLYLLLPLGLTCAQQPAETPTVATPERSLASLKTIVDPLIAAIEEQDKLTRELKEATTQEAREEIQTRLDLAKSRVRQLRESFRDMLGGAEAAEYGDAVVPENSSLQEQITDLLQPILGEIREATSEPRELDALRKSLEKWQDRKQKADTIISRTDELIRENKDPALVAELESARQFWVGKRAEVAGQIGVITAQIEDREKDRESAWEVLSRVTRDFFRSRGMNLLLALLFASLGFFGTRRAYRLIRRYSPVHRQEKRNLTSRLSDILAVGAAVLVALLAVVLVFYLRGDWLLLTLTVVLLLAIAWAGKTALPPYIEQVRLILNLGPVREGERVVHRGIPWKVTKIGFQTNLINPNLQGGLLILPIRDLMSMVSREPDPKEPWFPTEPDDWALLSDGTYGKVISQTPEQVVFLRLGGSLKTFPTEDFLEMAPERLSKGFRVSSNFGIDYRHQQDATDSIPRLLAEALKSKLTAEIGREAVRSIQVEFANAGSSSLNFAVLADFDGSVASKYQTLHRRIQRICVETCNEHGWVIPFNQITVHQAGNGSGNPEGS